jgi:hypothetical protein
MPTPTCLGLKGLVFIVVVVISVTCFADTKYFSSKIQGSDHGRDQGFLGRGGVRCS